MKKKIIWLIVVVAVGSGGYYAWKSGLFSSDSDGMQPVSALPSGASQAAVDEIPSYIYSEQYNNTDYAFSFKYPADFKVSEMQAEEGAAVLIQNLSKNIGMQILISLFDGRDIDLTKAVISESVPDMSISKEEEVFIGTNRKGLAFVSDNEAFGGNSREVWFVFRGNLYQISTYAEFDEFLKGLFATWSFD